MPAFVLLAAPPSPTHTHTQSSADPKHRAERAHERARERVGGETRHMQLSSHSRHHSGGAVLPDDGSCADDDAPMRGREGEGEEERDLRHPVTRCIPFVDLCAHICGKQDMVADAQVQMRTGYIHTYTPIHTYTCTHSNGPAMSVCIVPHVACTQTHTHTHTHKHTHHTHTHTYA